MPLRHLVTSALLTVALAVLSAQPIATRSAAQGAPQDISGTWVAHAEGPMGPMEIAYVLQVRDGHITGQQSLPFGDSPILDGAVTGDTFHFTVELESFGNLTKREVTGRIVGSNLVLTPAMPSRPAGGGPPSAAPGGTAATAPPAGATGAGGPGAGAPGRPPFRLGEVTLARGTPTPSYRPPAVDYATLPKVPLPAIHPLRINGLAQTPPMGWNSWNKFQTKIDDKTVRGVADAMVSSGMKAAGYQFVIIDDGWQGTRDAQGVLHPNPNFPDMKGLADYVHSKGLKIGIYSSPGPRTCGRFEGSYGHEAQDAQAYAAWGMDYLKYDWCSASRVWTDADMQAAYQKMGEALQATGRPIVYALCQYGHADVQKWAPQVGGNLWRTTGDIRDSYESMTNIGFAQSALAPFSGPGHWNDPDMLEVGNGKMSTEEYRTHLTLWSMIAAPLIAGNDLRSMPPEIHDMLTNGDVIAIDQDSLGKGGVELYHEGDLRVWSKPLNSGEIAVAVFNTADRQSSAALVPQRLGLKGNYAVRDVWTHRDLGRLAANFSANIPAHGAVMYRLRPIS